MASVGSAISEETLIIFPPPTVSSKKVSSEIASGYSRMDEVFRPLSSPIIVQQRGLRRARPLEGVRGRQSHQG